MTIKRILEVTKSYAIRHFFKDKNFIKPFIKDLSNDNICRITCDTNDNDIESILFCDFHEKNNIAYNTVKFFKENKDTLITDKNIPVKNFKWWYGLYNGKLIVNTLNNLPDDMTVIPVRNLQHNVNKPCDTLIIHNNLVYFNNGEVNLLLPYKQSGGNIGKSVLISPDGHSMLVYGVNYTTENELNKIKEFIKEHPCFPILIDNGRYLFYYVGEGATKEAFCCGGFAEIDEMFTFGTKK